MEKLSPEKIAAIRERDAEILNENVNFLRSLAARIGLEITAASPTVDEKGRVSHSDFLSKEEQKQANWTEGAKKNTFYLRGTAEDGSEVKAVVLVLPYERDSYAVDIFAPSCYQGHGGNHDFSQSELEVNLISALGKDKK